MAKRKKISRVIVPLILIALTALLFFGFFMLKRNAGEASETDAPEQAVNIITSSANDITRLTFDSVGGNFDLVKESGKWYRADDREFPLNQSVVTSMLGTVSTVNAVRTVEGGNDADFGFDNPTCTVTAVYTDGVSRTYVLGIVNAHNSNQYLKCGDGKVYMVTADFASAFEKTENDLLEGESLPEVGSSNAVDVTVKNPAGEYMTLSEGEAITSGIDAFKALDYLTIDRIYAPGGDMAQYGITDSSPYISVRYRESDESGADSAAGEELTYTIYFGNTYTADGDEYIYYSHPGSLVVYAIDRKCYDDAMALVHYTPETDAETVLS